MLALLRASLHPKNYQNYHGETGKCQRAPLFRTETEGMEGFVCSGAGGTAVAMLRSQAGPHPVLPLAENIWPQIRLLPSALLLNSSAKRRLGLKVYKTSQEATYCSSGCAGVYFRAARSSQRSQRSQDHGTCISVSAEGRCENILGSQSAGARAEQWGGLEAQEEVEMVFHKEQLLCSD